MRVSSPPVLAGAQGRSVVPVAGFTIIIFVVIVVGAAAMVVVTVMPSAEDIWRRKVFGSAGYAAGRGRPRAA